MNDIMPDRNRFRHIAQSRTEVHSESSLVHLVGDFPHIVPHNLQEVRLYLLSYSIRRVEHFTVLERPILQIWIRLYKLLQASVVFENRVNESVR
jgi:hypothetical protein